MGFVLALAVLTSHQASAQDASALAAELQILRQKVEQLEQKLKRFEQQAAPAPPSTNTTAVLGNQPLVLPLVSSTSISNQQIHATQPVPNPRVNFDEKGLSVSSSDDRFKVALRGTLQLDSRTTLSDDHPNNNKGFLLRRAQPILQGTLFSDFDFLFIPDFGGTGDPQIVDAYLNYRYSAGLQVRAGKFKPPLGLEQLQLERETTFIERAFPSSLVPNRDLGTELHGTFVGGKASYAAGIFTGVGDGRISNNSGFDAGGAFAGRVFFEPFKGGNYKSLNGLGVGLGGSYSFLQDTNAQALASCYGTPSQHPFFTFRPGTVAEDCHWRTTPQARYNLGPLGLLAEYAVSHQDVGIPESGNWQRSTLNNTAWQLSGGWVLTGEDADWSGLTPRNPFNPKTGHWGAWQVVARYAAIHLDDSAFSYVADPSTSSGGAHEWAAGVNWYLNQNLRISGSYSHISFDQAGAGSMASTERGEENTLFTRINLTF